MRDRINVYRSHHRTIHPLYLAPLMLHLNSEYINNANYNLLEVLRLQ